CVAEVPSPGFGLRLDDGNGDAHPHDEQNENRHDGRENGRIASSSPVLSPVGARGGTREGFSHFPGRAKTGEVPWDTRSPSSARQAMWAASCSIFWPSAPSRPMKS